MTRTGQFERVMSRILCTASCLLFLAALGFNLAELFASKNIEISVPLHQVRWLGGKPVKVQFGADYEPVVKHEVKPIRRHAVVVSVRKFEPVGGEPVIEWKPDEADVIALAQTLYGECRGCSFIQQCAVCWCIFNRIDSPKFPNTLIEVVSAPNQLQGYSSSNPVWDSLYEVAYNCMVDWHYGENRLFDEDMCFFSGWGGINHFRNAWLTEDATKFWEEQ